MEHLGECLAEYKQYELVKMKNSLNSLPVTLQDINKDLFGSNKKLAKQSWNDQEDHLNYGFKSTVINCEPSPQYIV